MNGENLKPLTGVKVVELATFVAAPAAARALADWGAEVIKIESLKGDDLRRTPPLQKMPLNDMENPSFDLENSNKKGIAIDLKSSQGKEILFKLLDEAKVFITNWRTDALKRLNLSYEELKVHYPKLIFAQVTGYGDKGPDKDLPGYDYTSYYARGGIMGTLFEKGTSPMNLVPGLGDHQVGLFLAAGICAALYGAQRTGKGEKVTVSLFHTAVYGMAINVQSAQYGKNHYPISRRDTSSPLLNSYRTKDDRWLEIAMPPYDIFFKRFITTLGRPELAEDDGFSTHANLVKHHNITKLCMILEECFETKTLKEWKQILEDGDFPFAVAQEWEEILEDEQAWESDILCEKEYPTGNKRTLVRTPVMFEEMGLPEYAHGPLIGEHTTDILQELGYDDEAILQLQEGHVVIQSKEKLAKLGN